jgi:hypothetical protein
MYHTHQPRIQEHIWSSEDGLLRAMLFVRLSVRRHLEQVKAMVDDVVANGPDGAKGMTNQERRSVKEIYAAVPDIFAGDYVHHTTPEPLISRILQIHGFGIVKAAFVAQLALGLGGCLDTHNVSMYGLNAKSFSADGSFKVVQGRLHLYLALCDQLGGSALLWNTWCTHVARLRPHVWKDAEHVSLYHVQVILDL